MFNTLSNNSIFLLFAKAFPKILQSLRLRHHLPIASVLLPADRVLQSPRRPVPYLPVSQINVIEGLLKRLEGTQADGGGLEAALPDDYRVPAEAGEGLVVTAVALAVALYLRAPEVDVGLGEAEVAAAFVAVPEAAVDEDTGAVLAKDDVGVAGQARMVEPVPEAAGVQPAADGHLGLGVSRTDGRHVLMPLLRGHRIHTARI